MEDEQSGALTRKFDVFDEDGRYRAGVWKGIWDADVRLADGSGGDVLGPASETGQEVLYRYLGEADEASSASAGAGSSQSRSGPRIEDAVISP